MQIWTGIPARCRISEAWEAWAEWEEWAEWEVWTQEPWEAPTQMMKKTQMKRREQGLRIWEIWIKKKWMTVKRQNDFLK